MPRKSAVATPNGNGSAVLDPMVTIASGKPAPSKTEEVIRVKPVNFEYRTFRIRGTAPYMQCRFSEKALTKMAEAQKAGQQARGKRVREPRDFDGDYLAAMHKDEKGRLGIPAPAFRNALISTCRLVGFKMTIAKLSCFVEADCFDAQDGTPLVLIHGEPERTDLPVRNATGTADIRVRPMWRDWWADLRLKWDADQFTLEDVINLLERAGQQVGIGEGRPDSKNSNGLGLGTFRMVDVHDEVDDE